MSRIVRQVVGQTNKNFPLILVGIGLVTTFMWIGTVVTVAIEQTWRLVLSVI